MNACNASLIKLRHFPSRTLFCGKQIRLACMIHDVRVRFAPSPTGHLHLGGLRTALYNYLFARANNGKFILRIEDTDQSRVVPGAISKIEEMIQWMGIEIDEGPSAGGNYGPYLQSQRLKIYQDSAKQLIENGSAYYCFCTERRLEMLRKEAAKRNETPRYDNFCRHLSKKELDEKLARKRPYVIRFKLLDEIETFHDLVYGPISLNIAAKEGDPIILKSDGYPTYHLANVVDDHLMKITHVLRGAEWQVSTTKHTLLYRAFNYTLPKFAHLPLIVNKDGTKLSKRQGDVHVEHFKDKGYLPQAVLNFAMSVGGGCGYLGENIYSLDQLTEKFSLENIKNHDARLDMEKLNIANRSLIHKMLADDKSKHILIAQVQELVLSTYSMSLGKNELQTKLLHADNVEKILHWSKNRINVLQDLVAPGLQFIWIVPDRTNRLFDSEKLSVDIIDRLCVCLENLSEQEFDKIHIGPVLKTFSRQEKLKFNLLMQFLRAILSNLQEGPSVGEIMEILGKQNTVDRLQHGVKSKDYSCNVIMS